MDMLYWFEDPTHVLLLIAFAAIIFLLALAIAEAYFGVTLGEVGRKSGRALFGFYIFQFTAIYWVWRQVQSPWFFGALADLFGSLVGGGPIVAYLWKNREAIVAAAQKGSAQGLPSLDSNDPIYAVGAAILFGFGIFVCRGAAAWVGNRASVGVSS
ncbi:MAG: hypothetical protein JSS56_01340 [Proteobacteria bacterium]|nr:hypothetical protein [Pseudomonadota bacterium]